MVSPGNQDVSRGTSGTSGTSGAGGTPEWRVTAQRRAAAWLEVNARRRQELWQRYEAERYDWQPADGPEEEGE